MIDYKTFKKEHLTEWVDRSQVAHKAAEELAMKEVKPSLRDKYKFKNVIMTLNGKQVEFKGENEKKRDGDIYFTYDEAKKSFGKPNKDGWRLPTKEEFEALIDGYTFVFDEDGEQGIFDNRLYLPAAGHRYYDGEVYDAGSECRCWSSSFKDSTDEARILHFGPSWLEMDYCSRGYGLSVRLVRDVK